MLIDIQAIRQAAKNKASTPCYPANAANAANEEKQGAISRISNVSSVSKVAGEAVNDFQATEISSVSRISNVSKVAGGGNTLPAPTHFVASSHGLETLPAPDPGMARLLALAMRFCEAIQASDRARKDWRSDIEAAPAQDRGGLAAYLRGELSKLVPPVAPKAAPPTATPAPTAAQAWRQADRADQLHYWSCTQCRTGPKCSKGQRLSDIYIEAATRERFIGAKPDPSKPLPKFHVAQPWCAADKAYQSHHWSCDACKAHARSNGHSDRCATGQHLYTTYEQLAPQATKEST